jgi:ATP-dependent helicase/nuclease subunit A
MTMMFYVGGMMTNKINIISASAGSGKTYSLKEELKKYLSGNGDIKIRPNAVIATTFTRKAAAELQERARIGLYEKGLYSEANLFSDSLVGTVHSVCGNILKKYCYEAGLSPELDIITEDDEKLFFEIALSQVVDSELNRKMYHFTNLFAFQSSGFGPSHDWRDDLKNVINLIRINNIDNTKLEESKAQSIEILKSLINAPEQRIFTFEQLKTSIDSAITLMEAASKMDKKSQALLPELKRISSILNKGYRISWEDVARIAVPGVGKVGTESLEEASGIATSLMSSKDLLEDIEEYQRTIFDLAERAISNYQKFKEERGVIDYTDMEVLVSNLLDDSEIQERIREDFDLLMVDEFQDTNPIQLNIFLKLSKLVKKSVWVGDPKQSIYGFRGADPILMNQLIQELDTGDNVSVLENSYRSRECLVQTSNNISKVLFKNDLVEERIVLNPTREEVTEFSTGLNILRFNPERRGSKPRMNRSLAHAVTDILSQGLKVLDRETKEIRDLERGDIAILCRFNDTCTSLAEYLKEEGIEAAVERNGLLETPEGALINSCLKYYNFKYDDLSKFEITLLADENADIEGLLNNRLEFVKENKEKLSEWQKDHLWIRKIDELRERMVDSSVVEILDALIFSLRLKSHVSLWDRGSLRKANVEKFRELAQKFEDRCIRLSLPCTLTGFLLWLSNEDAPQGAGAGKNAINIVTYHRSKGLEWPVLIMAELDAGAKARGFGVKVQSSIDTFDMNNPLAGRWIRFLTNPFGTKKNVPFIANMEASELYAEELQRGIEENARLMYVGITRARDYLYLVERGDTGFTWLNEIYDKKEETLEIEKEDGEYVFNEIPYVVKNYPMLDSFETNRVQNNEFTVLKMPAQQEELPPYRLLASSSELDTEISEIKEYEYSKPLAISGELEDDNLGDCLHNILANPNFDKETTEKIINNYSLEKNIDADEVFAQCGAFYDFLKSELKLNDLNNEWPVQIIENGQCKTGIIDLWGKESEIAYIIDHKSYRGGDLLKKTNEFFPQLQMYKDLLSKESGEKRVFINYISLGKLVEVIR